MGRRRKHNRHLPQNLRYSHGQYFVTEYQAGKQRWVSLGRDYHQALVRFGDRASYTPPIGKTVADLVERFRREEIPKLKASSQRNYKYWSVTVEKTWGGMLVREVRQPHAAVFLDEYPRKVTANRVVTLLTTMLKRAKRWGWIDVNYLEGLEHNPEHRRVRTIAAEEWQQLLEHAHHPYQLLFRLARVTALRRGDICGLRWSNVRDGRLVVATEKTDIPLSFGIAGELAEIFAELRRGIMPFPTRPIFAVAGGRPLRTSMLGYHFDQIRERAGLVGVNFHDIRRTRITELTERHGLEFAQRVAGHTTPATTERYNTPEAMRIDFPIEESTRAG